MRKLLLSLVAAALLFAGCDNPASDPASTKSSDASLSSITVTNGTLSPSFSSGTTDYTVSVANSITSVIVTGKATSDKATVSGSVTLNTLVVGVAQTATIKVTAEDGTTTKTYTVKVTRAADPKADATLSGIALSSGSLTPQFSAEVTDYTVSVGYSVTSVTVTGTKNAANAKVTGAVTLSNLVEAVPQTATITVTAEDGTTTKKYTVAVTRQAVSSDATLSALTVTDGTLLPTFSAATTVYDVGVANSISSVTVTGTANNVNASVTGPVTLSGLVVGSTQTATITVTAENGTTTKTYTVRVTRQAASAKSSDATLSALAVSEGTLTPAFTPANLTYTVSVPNSVDSITVTGTKNDSKAAVSSTSGTAQELDDGANPIEIVVTAEDGTTKTYTVVVTREAYVPSGNVTTLPGSADGSYNIGDGQTLVISAGVTTMNNVTYTLKFDATGAVIAYDPSNKLLNTGFTWDGTNLKKNGVNVPKTTTPNPSEYSDLPAAADGTWSLSNTVVFTISGSKGKYVNSNVASLTYKFDSSQVLYYLNESGTPKAITGFTWDGSAIKYKGAALIKGTTPSPITYSDLPSAADGTWSVGGKVAFTIANGQATFASDGKVAIVKYDSTTKQVYTFDGNNVASPMENITWDGSTFKYQTYTMTKGTTPTPTTYSDLPAAANGTWSISIVVMFTVSGSVQTVNGYSERIQVDSNGVVYRVTDSGTAVTGFTWNGTAFEMSGTVLTKS